MYSDILQNIILTVDLLITVILFKFSKIVIFQYTASQLIDLLCQSIMYFISNFIKVVLMYLKNKIC